MENGRLYVAGVAASAGGLEAISQLVGQIPDDLSGLAIVVAQHLHSQNASRLTDLLKRMTTLEVETVQHQMPLLAGHIYIAPPGKHVAVSGNRLILEVPENPLMPSPSADVLFTSLATTYGDHAIGIVLSGTGRDGLAGCQAIADQGGTILTQDLNTARFSSMPSAVMDAGIECLSLPPESIGHALKLMLTGAFFMGQEDTSVVEVMKKLILVLQHGQETTRSLAHYPHGISMISERMRATGSKHLHAYLELISREQEELATLIEGLSAATFFDHENKYDRIAQLLTRILASKPQKSQLRIWFSGCERVEDAYTLAMLVDHCLQKIAVDLDVKIFVTHPDPLLVQSVRQERMLSSEEWSRVLRQPYAPGAVKQEEYLRRLRGMLLFSRHNAFSHPPFLNMDMVVYADATFPQDPSGQEQVLNMISAALDTLGYLVWGQAQKPACLNRLFRRSDLGDCCYRKHPEANLEELPLPEIARPMPKLPEQTLFLAWAQSYPYAIITEEGKIISLSEGIAPFLAFQDGNMSRDILQNCHPALLPQMRTLLFKIQQEEVFRDTTQPLKSRICYLEDHTESWYCRLVLGPVREEGLGVPADGGYYLFFEYFHPEDLPEVPGTNIDHPGGGQVNHLLEWAQHAEANQEILVEELEVSNEELQSLNERLHNANEELQASIEELELTNQELNAAHKALSEAHESLKRSQLKLQISEEKNRNILEHTSQGFLLVDKALALEQINPAGARILHHLSDREAEAKETILDFFPPSAIPDLLKVTRLGFHGEVVRREWKLETVAGEDMWLDLHIIPVMDETGVPLRLTLSLQDVTRQREADLKLKLHEAMLQSVFEEGDTATVILNEEGEVIQGNQAYFNLVGYTQEELGGKPFYLTVPPEEMASSQAHHKAVLETGTPAQIICRRQHKSGQLLDWVMSSRRLVDLEGRRFRVASCRDVTDFNRQHHLLQQTESTLKIAGWEWDIYSNHFICTEAFSQILGIETGGDLHLETLLNRLVPEARTHLSQALEAAREDGRSFDLRVQGTNEAGQTLWLHTTGHAVRLEGHTYRVYGSIQDITALKASEALIEKLSLVASHTHNGVMIADARGRIEWANEAFSNLTGFSLEEVRGRTPGEVLQGPGTDPATRAYINQRLRNREPASCEILNYRKDGRPFWSRIEVTPMLNEQGEVTQFLGIQSDVTESVRHREEISRQRIQLQAVLESTSDLIWAVDRNLRLRNFNSAYADMLEQWLGIEVEPNDVLPHDAKPRAVKAFWRKAYRQALRGESIRVENSFEIKGKLTHYEFVLQPVLDAEEVVQGVSVFGRDITERRQAEEQLRQSGANLSALINNTDDIILSVDPEYRLLTFNQAYADRIMARYGVTIQAGNCVLDYLPPERRAAWESLIAGALSGQTHSEIQEDVFGSETVYFGLSLTPIRDGSEVIGCTIFSRDLTEVKQSEQELFDSKELLVRLLGNAPVQVFAKDREGRFTQVNARMAEHFGRRAEEMLGRTLAQLTPDPWATRHMEWEAQVIESQQSMTFYEDVMRASGQAHYQHIRFPIFDSKGIVKGVGGITMDITESVESQRQIADIAERLRLATS
ncbi:MAG: PAS domain S-box protein, partial [Bacteroidetes bacterium]